MIITRTPLRISLVGGGTDMAAYYHQAEFGAVVSMAINKYIYVSINDKFDGRTRVSYSEMETVDDPIDLKHDLIRGTLGYFNLKGLEISSVSDIPGEGTGLGSSSAFIVGLVLGLMKYTNRSVNTHPSFFADLAYDLEKGRCKHVVGKQDHFASAYGGLYFYRFNQDESVITEPIHLVESSQRRLEKELMLFWTGKTRESGPILTDQWERFKKGDWWMLEIGNKLRDLALQLGQELRHGNVDSVGEYLHEGWQLKKKMSHIISNPEIDELYSKARSAGATGGKLLGAGGGGFLLLAARPDRQFEVEKALKLRRVPWRMSMKGSVIVYPCRGD